MYGVRFKRENIVFLDEPDFTYEGDSILDKLNNVSGVAQDVANKLISDTADKAARIAKENGDMEKYEYYSNYKN